MKLRVKNTPNLSVPQPGTPKASGYDMIAVGTPTIVGEVFPTPNPREKRWKRIDYIEYHTGLFVAPEATPNVVPLEEFHTLIFPRSSLSKYNLSLANSIGLIDNDYRGEILLRFKYLWQPEDFVVETNGVLSGKINEARIYKPGDKIGQLVAEVHNPIEWVVVNLLDETVRGEGGFGSTDTKPEQFTTPIISDAELIRIRSTGPKIKEEVEPPTRKYSEDTPYHKTAKSGILEQWKAKSESDGKPVVGYEKLMKEKNQ